MSGILCNCPPSYELLHTPSGATVRVIYHSGRVESADDIDAFPFLRQIWPQNMDAPGRLVVPW